MDCKKRRYYTNELKKEIIQKVKDGISRSDIQKEYGISKSSLSRWITLMRERRYRSVNTVKKYTDTIEAKKYIINQKLATITKDLAALKARATADLMTMMMEQNYFLILDLIGAPIFMSLGQTHVYVTL
mgnify:CR=1 FL=1